MDKEAKLSILHEDNSAQSYMINPEAEMPQIQYLINAHKKMNKKPIFAMFIQKPNQAPVEVTSLYDIRLSNV